MPSGWWYGTAVGVVLVAGSTTLIAAAPEGGPSGFPGDLTAAAFLVGTLLVSVTILLDIRALRGDVPWSPSGARWGVASLVPVLNASVGVAYCIRRLAAVRGTVPGENWRPLVAASGVVWVAAFAIEVAVDHVSLPLVDRYLFGPLLAVGMFVAPVAVYLDAARVRGHTEWAPRAGLWAVGAAIPYVGALVCLGFLVRRRRAVRTADDPRTVSLPDAEGDADAGRPSSPWFRAAAALFALHLLLVLALSASAGAGVSETAIELAAVLLWLPFGPFFAACVYKDARWRRENDREVGENWYLYLVALLVQAAAFWYLLRRVAKTADTRPRPEAAETKND